MLDWFRGEINIVHKPLPAGGFVSYDEFGQVEFDIVKKIKFTGSHDSTIQLRSRGSDKNGNATSLQIDGNISKFLQGHNVIGSRNINALVWNTFEQISRSFPDHFPVLTVKATLKLIGKGDYLVNMIDINQLYDLGNDESVEQWLYAAEMRCRSRSGRSVSDRGTVYVNKTSRRWGYKFYNKHRELKARGKDHKTTPEVIASGIIPWCVGKLRAELRLHSLELKDRGITHGYHLSARKLTQLFNEYTGRIHMTSNVTIIDKKLFDLPRHYQATYQLWRTGLSVRDLSTKTTYFRHRKFLLTMGIDIAIPPVDPDRSNVIPLMRVVEAKPVANPKQFEYLVAA